MSNSLERPPLPRRRRPGAPPPEAGRRPRRSRPSRRTQPAPLSRPSPSPWRLWSPSSSSAAAVRSSPALRTASASTPTRTARSATDSTSAPPPPIETKKEWPRGALPSPATAALVLCCGSHAPAALFKPNTLHTALPSPVVPSRAHGRTPPTSRPVGAPEELLDVRFEGGANSPRRHRMTASSHADSPDFDAEQEP